MDKNIGYENGSKAKRTSDKPERISIIQALIDAFNKHAEYTAFNFHEYTFKYGNNLKFLIGEPYERG